MKAINSIPATYKPTAQYAAMKLAGVYWQHGRLPLDCGQCAKLIGIRTRTLQVHWREVIEILDTYFADMIEARPKVVAMRRAKQAAGRAGGSAGGESAAKAPAVSAEHSHFLKAERESNK